MSKKNFYAIKQGRKSNLVVSTWKECSELVNGVANDYKGFKTEADAYAWLGQAELPLTPTVSTAGEVLAFTDGSFRNDIAGWAFSIWKDGKEIAFDSGTTAFIESNNIGAELAGAMHAMKWAYANDTPVVIVHDYVGISKWPSGEWKVNATGLAKIYIKGYIETMRQGKAWILRYDKVAGHSGNPGNERADELAGLVTGKYTESIADTVTRVQQTEDEEGNEDWMLTGSGQDRCASCTSMECDRCIVNGE
jgi:ribonuclease H-related protein